MDEKGSSLVTREGRGGLYVFAGRGAANGEENTGKYFETLGKEGSKVFQRLGETAEKRQDGKFGRE